MNRSFWSSAIALALAIAASLSAPAFVAAQSKPEPAAAKPAASAPAKSAEKKPWTMPRTPDGQPSLEGYWTSLSFTPMERPAKFNGREFLTDAEEQQIYKEGIQHSYEYTFNDYGDTPVYDATVYALSAWQEGVARNHRTSLVVDPPDGKIPALTPAGQKARDALRRVGANQSYADPDAPVKADNSDDLNLGERCLTFGGPPILPGGYNSNYHIVQGAGYVVIEYEWGSDTRVIPIDAGPHPSSGIHEWHGDSRGHWEGNTLVVETTNFHPGAAFQNANPDTLKMTEYFTRTDDTTVEYKFVVNDPATWTKPWTAVVPLSHQDGPIFEYACTEGNNGVVNILAGARAAEKVAKEKGKALVGTPVSRN